MGSRTEQAAWPTADRLLPQIAPRPVAADAASLSNHLESGPLKVKRLDVALRRRALKQRLEDAPANANSPLVWPEDHAEFDAVTVSVPSYILGRFEEVHWDLRAESRVFTVCSMIGSRWRARMGVQVAERQMVSGQRMPGGFIVITAQDGIRYAVRHSAIAGIQDADQCRDKTLVCLHGGVVVR